MKASTPFITSSKPARSDALNADYSTSAGISAPNRTDHGGSHARRAQTRNPAFVLPSRTLAHHGPIARSHSSPEPLFEGRDYGRGCLGWVGCGSPGNDAERPSWFPRCISSLTAGLPGGAVSRQLQLRVLYGLGPAFAGLGSALAGAASPTQEPRAIAALISVFVIRSRFGNPTADRFRFAIDMTTLLGASRDFFISSPPLRGRVMP
jgi:hypothetical protein